MKQISNLIVATLVMCLMFFANTITSALAQQESDRFAIEKDGENYLRVDRKSGATAFCRIINDSPVCQLSVEERAAMRDEITKLQDEVSTLREKLAVAGESDQLAKRDEKSNPPADKPRFGEELDEEALDRELDRAVEFTKKTVRRFFDVVKELKQEFEENGKL